MTSPTDTSARPRGRREEQRERTRRDLLDAAARVFAAQGYHAASVDDVAEAAGYTKGAVYSNFDSKEELFLALLERQIDQAVGVLEGVLQEAAPEDVGRLVGERQGAIAVLDRDWFLLETEFLLYAARNASVRDRIADRQRRTQERITELIARHMDDLGVDTDVFVPADVAQLLTATADGLTQASLVDDVDAGRLLSLQIQLFVRAAMAR